MPNADLPPTTNNQENNSATSDAYREANLPVPDTQQSLEMLQLIMEHSPLIMSVLDAKDYNYIMVSRKLADLAQLEPAQMVNLSPFRDRPGLAEATVPLLEKVIQSRQTFSAKAFALPTRAQVDKSGQGYWNLKYSPIFGENGEVVAIFSLIDDVTEQVLQARQLEQKTTQQKARVARLETILTNLSEAVIVINTENRVILANQVAEEMAAKPLTGELAVDVFQQRTCLDGRILVVEETSAPRALRGETTHNLRYLVENNEGQIYPISASGGPVYDENGQISSAVVLFADISQQLRQQEQLEAIQTTTERAQAALLEMAAAAAGVTDLPQLLNRFVNIIPTVVACDRVSLYFYEPEKKQLIPQEVYGLAGEALLHWRSKPKSVDNSLPYFATVFEQQLPYFADFAELEAFTLRQNLQFSNPFGVKSALFLPLAYGQKFIGLLSVSYLTSIHQFSPAEIAILDGMARLAAIAIGNLQLLSEAGQSATLREANLLKDEFLSLVAHELRNPLTAVQGYTQMTQRKLRRIGIAEEDLKPLETIIAQAQRMTRLVEDLLDLSRIETGRLELRLQPCDLATLISRTLETYSSTSANHRFDVDLKDGPGYNLYSGEYDCDRLEQVLNNLVSNAIKYSPKGGLIQVTLERSSPLRLAKSFNDFAPDAPLLHFAISDQGIGIPPEQQVALFERFYRADNSRDSGLPGLGLGLYISSQIIALHNGWMWVESVGQNQGSTFHFVLP